MNIYVGNLSRDVDEEDLKKAFETFGKTTSVTIVKDKYTSVSRGFGFVEMSSKEDAQSAIADLNGKEMKGQGIKVSEARARTENRRNDGTRGGGGRGGRRY